MERKTLRTETDGGVRSLILCRPEEYKTLTPDLRDELASALDEAEADPDIRVLVLRSTGRAFCAGYGLGWTVERHLREEAKDRVWDSVTDSQVLRLLCRGVPKALVLQQAYCRGGQRMVSRRRYGPRAVGRSDNCRRIRLLWLPSFTSLGSTNEPDVDSSFGL